MSSSMSTSKNCGLASRVQNSDTRITNLNGRERSFRNGCLYLPRANDCAVKYGYNVTFIGVGGGKSSKVGYCSQFAIFTRIAQEVDMSLTDEPLTHFDTIEFPYFDEQWSDAEILEELKIQAEYTFSPNHEPPVHTVSPGALGTNISKLWDILRYVILTKRSSNLHPPVNSRAYPHQRTDTIQVRPRLIASHFHVRIPSTARVR
jgi:hypothetical protein